jgi:uncharacterized integral membrane protein
MSAMRNSDLGGGPQYEGEGRGRPPWRLIGLIAVVAVAAIFVLQNRERMPVDFLFFEINSRQWVNIAVSILLGIVLDRLFIGWRRRHRSAREQD